MSSSTKSHKDSKPKPKTHSHDSIPSFIRKTYDILEERKFPDIIDWNPEGTALVIKKPTEFCLKVLPAYFKHNNLTSFVRQLNMYNFHKRRTQNIDHVYYHELFQKGKKNLLREIRRKTQNDAPTEKPKATETEEGTETTQEQSSLSYENQLLKRLYNDAMTKLAQLENQIKDMSNENQSLWNQLAIKQETDIDNGMLLIRKQQSGLTQDQLPMTLSNISIPPLKLNIQRQISGQGYLPIAKGQFGRRFFGTGEEMGESTAATEASKDSPNTKKALESDHNSELQETLNLQFPQVSQLQALRAYSDLNISRQEMSVGQLFEAWNQENLNPELHGNLLGKRQLDLGENTADFKFQVPEPPMKRHDLSIFNRRGLISTGTEEKDLLRSLLRRDSSIGEEFGHNGETGLDLMDFNHPFFAFSKTN